MSKMLYRVHIHDGPRRALGPFDTVEEARTAAMEAIRQGSTRQAEVGWFSSTAKQGDQQCQFELQGRPSTGQEILRLYRGTSLPGHTESEIEGVWEIRYQSETQLRSHLLNEAKKNDTSIGPTQVIVFLVAALLLGVCLVPSCNRSPSSSNPYESKPLSDPDLLYADFHALRHSYISLITQGGVHPKLAQKLARHSDINLTMSRYSHTLLADESEALKVLPEFPSVFDGGDNQRHALRATGTDAADTLPQNVLPLCLPEKGTPDRNSVHLSAVSASDEGRNSKITPAAKKPANPVKQRETQAVKSGEGGIRTPGTREGTPVFETGTFGHSVTSPETSKPRKERGFGRKYKQSCRPREVPKRVTYAVT